MAAVHAATRHWPEKSVHFESFAGRAAAGAGDSPAFSVEIASRCLQIDVAAEQTLLEALRAAGIAIASSCEAGTCGSCRVKYLSGTVEHRDMVLSADERRDQLMACVSRGRGTVKLDL
jgi:phthalate 4,5-dioxygenase reductase subunit